MHTVNLRHPGYPDSSNTILTLQAPDAPAAPGGGIHAETLRLAGCIVAGNRWDGFLSVTQEHPQPVLPDRHGILRGKDFYFHLPSREENFGDEVVDRRKARGPEEPWPMVARFADWQWPEDGMPYIWKLAEASIARQAEAAKTSGAEHGSQRPGTCRLCGEEEELSSCRLWSYGTEGERMIWEREKSKIGIAANLRSDYDSDDENDESEDSGSDESDVDNDDDGNHSNTVKGGSESERTESGSHEPNGKHEDLGEDGHSGKQDTTAPNDVSEQVNDDENTEHGGDVESESTEESSAGDNDDEDKSKDDSDELDDDRNWIRIGKDCSVEPDGYGVAQAYDLHQWLFVPKIEQNGEPVLRAHIFATREDGITQVCHNRPLKWPWKNSIELTFAHFVQAVFEQVTPFFEAGVARSVQIIDIDGQTMLLDAEPQLCELLLVPAVTKMWASEPEEDGASGQEDSSDSGQDNDEEDDGEEDDGIEDDSEEEDDRQDEDDDDSRSEAKFSGPGEEKDAHEKKDPDEMRLSTDIGKLNVELQNDGHELKEHIVSSEEFNTTMQELAALLADANTEDESTQQTPETTIVRIFPDIVCDICDGSVRDVRYVCLDCEGYDLCGDCIDERSEHHPGHSFLPIHESGWRKRVPTGRMLSLDGSVRADETFETAHGPMSSHLMALLEVHIDSGDFLQYAESLTDMSPDSAKIRILHLLPGEDDMPIMGNLETTPLHSSSFEALSYCWGDPNPRRIINISGARLEVGTNLKLALFRLRDAHKERHLWIDGICINQGDMLEKTAQVTLMRNIYEQAEQTIVWLGEEDEKSQQALNLCNRMVEAHGSVYIRETLGIDVEQLYAQTVGDDAQIKTVDQDELEQAMRASGKTFDLDLAMVDYFRKVSQDSFHGADYDGPLKELVQYELAKQEIDSSTLETIDWEDVGRRVAMGEEYEGPFKELVYAAVAEALAEADSGDDEAAIDQKQDSDAAATPELAIETSGADRREISSEPMPGSSGTTGSSQYHFRVIAQILAGVRQRKTAEPPSASEVAALHDLLQRPWFTRIWIVQEAGVSSQTLIRCGGQTIDWWVFSFGFLITQTISPTARLGSKSHRNLVLMSRTRSNIHTVKSMKHLMTEPDASLSLSNLLSTYRGYDATDARDKVFALLGICNPVEGLMPDYTKSCCQVYEEVATKLLHHSGNLDLLTSCNFSPDSELSTPSWAPDWSAEGRRPYKLAGDQNFENNDTSSKPIRAFTACGSTTTKDHISITSHKLHLPGIFIDTISDLARPLLIDQEDLLMPITLANIAAEDFSTILTSLRRFFHVLIDLPSTIEAWKLLAGVTDEDVASSSPLKHEDDANNNNDNDNDNDILTTFSRTLWTDLATPTTCRTDCAEWLQKLSHLRNLTENLPDLGVVPAEDNLLTLLRDIMPIISGLDPNKLKLFHELGAVHTLERRQGKTEKGRLALVPKETEVGDRVVVLRGGSAPFVVRRAVDGGGEEGEEFRLVGEAYVHGVMYGEAWDEARCRDVCII